MDEWSHLKHFLAVARHGTLTSAAEHLGIGTATLHRQVAAFEAELGASLFEKGPRGYRLTNVGEALLPQAEEVEEAVLAATRTVVGHDDQAAGEVRITLPLLMLSELAPHFAAFSRKYPGVQLVLQPAEVELDLRRDTDLALRATTQPLDAAVGRRLCGLAWGRYASADSVGDQLPWIHYRGMDGAPAVQWRKRTQPAAEPMMYVLGVPGMLAVLAASGG
ncbi:MAG: LysR family transcriptional regulator, partial [Halobacteriales archaeon]|nr:LysR family transcriptional regulator [Halobacteriales archaeon]